MTSIANHANERSPRPFALACPLAYVPVNGSWQLPSKNRRPVRPLV